VGTSTSKGRFIEVRRSLVGDGRIELPKERKDSPDGPFYVMDRLGHPRVSSPLSMESI